MAVFAGLDPHGKQKILSSPERRGRTLRWSVWIGCVVLFLWFVSLFYLPGQGFTALLNFGERERWHALAEVRSADVYVVPNSYGYDGQYYAQLAMRPDVSDPAVAHAMDNLPYRARRLLLSAVAWLVGGGDPIRAMHVYSVLNVVAWLGLAVFLLRWFPLRDWSNLPRWFAVMFTAGLWFSVRNALTDGPSLLLVAAAVALIEQGRRWAGAAVLGVAGLVRETNVLAAPALAPDRLELRGWGRVLGQALVVVAPLLIWLGVLHWVLDGARGTPAANFAPPFQAYWQEWYESLEQWPRGRWYDETGAGVFVLLGLTVQALFLFLRPTVRQPWWRIGVCYALLMTVLGHAVWEGFPGAASRVLLPMTLAFNVLVPRGRRWWAVLVLGNLTVVPTLLMAPPVMGDVYRVVAPAEWRQAPGTQERVRIRFDERWGPMEQSRYRQDRWRWAVAATAGAAIVNPHDRPLHADLRFELRSTEPRDLEIRLGGSVVWTGSIGPTSTAVYVESVELSPGETSWEFETRAPVEPASERDPRTLAFQLRLVQLRPSAVRADLAAPPP